MLQSQKWQQSGVSSWVSKTIKHWIKRFQLIQHRECSACLWPHGGSNTSHSHWTEASIIDPRRMHGDAAATQKHAGINVSQPAGRKEQTLMWKFIIHWFLSLFAATECDAFWCSAAFWGTRQDEEKKTEQDQCGLISCWGWAWVLM